MSVRIVKIEPVGMGICLIAGTLVSLARRLVIRAGSAIIASFVFLAVKKVVVNSGIYPRAK